MEWNDPDLTARQFSRRRFLRWLAAGAVSLTAACGEKPRSAPAGTGAPADSGAPTESGGTGLKARTRKTIATDRPLAVVTGASDPGSAAREAVGQLGGMGRFVKTGDLVVVKPNIGWDRTPELAANTNPEVVAAVVTMAREAGAREVRVFDNCCNDARRSYKNSGIAAAAEAAGAVVSHPADWKYQPGEFPAGSLLADWPLCRDAVKCDVLINVPIAKHHELARLTLGMKNLMGVCGGSRGEIHQRIDPKIVELTRFFAPELTIIDAWRILLRNGPQGGDPDDVEERRTVIASADPVLADARAAALFGLRPDEIGYITAGAAAGLGSLDLSAV